MEHIQNLILLIEVDYIRRLNHSQIDIEKSKVRKCYNYIAKRLRVEKLGIHHLATPVFCM